MATQATLNWRFFGITTFALLATMGIIYFWHGRQVRRQTGAYLHQADLARDKKDEGREMVYLDRYLRAQPGSNDSRDRLARLRAKNAQSRKQIEDAFYLLEDCVRREPDNDDLRRFTIEFAMNPRTSLIFEADDHLKYLIAKYPSDAESIERLGMYHTAKLEYKAACEQFRKAYDLQTDRLNAYAGHALIERERLNNPDSADGVIGLMIERNKENFRAHLFAHEYWRKYRIFSQAQKEIEAARTLKPDEFDVILAYADWNREEAKRLRLTDAPGAKVRLAEARTELQRGSALALANRNPDTPPPPQAISILLLQASIEAEAVSPTAAAKILSEATPAYPGNVAVFTSLFDYQIQASDLAGADATFAVLDKLDIPPTQRAYERARLNFARRNCLPAARELRRILDDQPSDQAFVRSVNFLLGRCYEQIGETERRLGAFTRAIPSDVNDPLWVLAQIGQAEAYSSLGRADDALRTYAKLTDRAPETWLAVARLRILQALRTADPTSINWGPSEEAVQNCQLAMPGRTEAKLLQAELFYFQKRESDARAIVDPLFETRKREPSVWIAKAFSVARESTLAAGIALLEQGRRELGDPVELRLAQAQLLVKVNDGTPDSQLLTLSRDIEHYPPADRRRLLHGLAETASASGFVELGSTLWDRVIQLNPDDLHALLVRFDKAFRSGDHASMEKMRDEIARIDGAEGVSTRIANVFITIANEQRTKDRVGLDAAMQILNRLERDRPEWSRITLGKALIFERKGDATAALAHFRKAVNQGESQPDVLRRLVNLLAERGQYDEANAVLDRLPNEALGSPDAMRMAADVSLRADNPKRALELAAKAVAPNSTNHEDFLWKGRLLWSASDREGSRAAFRKASVLNPGDPTAWLLLIETLTFDKRMNEAESVFRDSKDKVRGDVALLFKAQAHKLLGQKQEAQTAFANARKSRPNDVNVLRSEADFLMSDAKMPEAREAWNRVIRLSSASPAEKDFAKNMLAFCLALDPDYATARTAVTTLELDQAGLTSTESSISKRTKAVVLSLQRDRANKLKAIRMFQDELENLTDNERFLLAQWYFQVNDEAAGHKTLIRLLSRSPADRNPLFLTYYAGWLLARGEAREAEPWVAKLEKLEPNTLRTIELKVQLLAGLRNLAAARTLIKDQAEKPNANYRLLGIIAEGAGLYAEAETLNKRYVENERGKKAPELDFDLALAGFYARRGRLKETLDVCEKAWSTCRPEKVALLCVEAISATLQVDPATLQRVWGWIEDARTKNPNLAPEFLQHQAYIRNLQEQYDEAIRIYQQLATRREPSPTVLNNLAFLLSIHKGQHKEALELITRAKLKEGPLPDLLDTEALILMTRRNPGDLDLARARLQEALDQAPSATIYFHKAQLEEKAGDRDATNNAWREAKNLKLKANDLHPLEKKEYDRMVKAN